MPDAVDPDLARLLEKSAGADLRTLLGVKEKARKAMLEEPSSANVAAFERASKALEAAQAAASAKAAPADDAAPETLPDIKAALAFIAGQGRKCSRSKLFADVSKGRLRRQADGAFRVRDVERYMASLALAGTPEGVVEVVADRQRRKEEADIRKAEAQARREEFNLAVLQGKYLPRDQIAAELAMRAVALRDGLKTAMESAATDIVDMVRGDAKETPHLVEFTARMLDRALNEYARPLDIAVEFSGIGPDDGADSDADAPDADA